MEGKIENETLSAHRFRDTYSGTDPRGKSPPPVLDSLSSGVGLAGAPSLVGAGPAVYGLDGNYALLTAEHFQADFRILAQCGWGVHCSCYNDFIQIMPRYYEQVCGVLTGDHNRELGAVERNDFTAWQPDLVVVNLGSNDGFEIGRAHV